MDSSFIHIKQPIDTKEGTPLASSSPKKVAMVMPKSMYSISFTHTTISLEKEDNVDDVVDSEFSNALSFASIGGLDRQINLIRELVELPLKFSHLYQKCGLSMPTGILLFGPSGTGKSMLTRATVQEIGVNHVSINGPELASKFYGETESKIRDIFADAIAKSPTIIIIDELDSLCPVRTQSSNETEKRVVSTLMSLMDDLTSNRNQVIVLAATNRPDQVDPILRRPGRFDREIEIGVPNAVARADILKKILSTYKHSLSEEHIMKLADNTHGYVGADLSAVCREAGIYAMNNLLAAYSGYQNENLNMESLASQFSLTVSHMEEVLVKIRPSALRSVMVDIPKVSWKDVGGQDAVKQKLKEATEWPLKHSDAFQRLGITPPRGLLMFGPPGCSKTLMAKALATESGLNFISIKGPELFDKFLGESEKAVREVFRKARLAAPSIVFFDEIDALGMQRSGSSSGSGNVSDRVLAQILTEMDGVEGLNGVIIIAATNRPDVIDPALLRPGRIDRLIYVPLPDEQTRREIFEIQFRTMSVGEDLNIDQLVSKSEGYSGAEICAVTKEAGLAALREDMEARSVSQRHFDLVFDNLKPRTSEEAVKFYTNYVEKTGSLS